MKHVGISSVLFAGVATAAGAGSGCTSGGNGGSKTVSQTALLAPETCLPCHEDHFNQWSNSMHAHAADDPVFIAMNARMQRETNGQFASFCVQCHAPMAVHEKVAIDPADASSLPSMYKGVTCYFCHNIDSVEADGGYANASVHLADDTVMRGEITDPVSNPVHGSKYSTLHDKNQFDSAQMCGACHDIVSPAGAHIERTFAEWSTTPFATELENGGSTCTNDACHMNSTPNVAIATCSTGECMPKSNRTFHTHDFSAVDVPLSTTPAPASNTTLVEKALASAVSGALCFSHSAPPGMMVVLDTPALGHNWPSGASQDRRAWTEIVAYDANGNIIYSSGLVDAGTPITETAYDPVKDAGDPDLFLLRDCMFDSKGNETHNFWQAATTNGSGLPAILTFDFNSPDFYRSHIWVKFPSANNPRYPTRFLDKTPARITLRLLLQPIGLDVLKDLVDSGDLDPGPNGSLLANMPTFNIPLQGPLGPVDGGVGLEWTQGLEDDAGVSTSSEGVSYKCITSPGFSAFPQNTVPSFATCTRPSGN